MRDPVVLTIRFSSTKEDGFLLVIVDYWLWSSSAYSIPVIFSTIQWATVKPSPMGLKSQSWLGMGDLPSLFFPWITSLSLRGISCSLHLLFLYSWVPPQHHYSQLVVSFVFTVVVFSFGLLYFLSPFPFQLYVHLILFHFIYQLIIE